jgi:peptide/nickel transport system permease protein
MSFVARRLLRILPTLLGLTVVTFLLLRLAPGDPALLRFAQPDAPAAANVERAIEQFRASHLLDRSLLVQYLHYLGPFHLGPEGHEWFGGSGADRWHGLLAFDLGREYLRPSVSVASEIGARLAVTVPLALASALLAYAIAVPLGIFQALRRGSAFDVGAGALTLLLYSTPAFWAGLLLQLALGPGGAELFPAIGLHDKDASTLGGFEYALDTLRHAVLPIACMTYASLAFLSRHMRSAVLENVRADYVRAARAKGLPERVVVMRHVVRNSLLPIVTLVGHLLPWLVAGSVAVETVFEIPGLGKYALDSLQSREYDAVAGCVLVSGLATTIGFLVSDLLYGWADPRIRHGES